MVVRKKRMKGFVGCCTKNVLVELLASRMRYVSPTGCVVPDIQHLHHRRQIEVCGLMVTKRKKQFLAIIGCMRPIILAHSGILYTVC